MRLPGRTLTLTLALGILCALLAAEPQHARQVYRIGVLWPTPSRGPGLDTFVRGLRELAYVEGRNQAGQVNRKGY